MKDESGSSESVAVMTVFVCLVLAALFYAVIILVKLLLWGLLIAAIGVAVYFLIKQTGASREIETNLRKVLAQVEGQEPIEIIPALSSASVEWQEAVLKDSEWSGLK